MTIRYKSGKNRFQINIPDHVQDITFGQFIDFRDAEGRFFAAEDLIEKHAALTDCVRAVVTGDLDNLPVMGEELSIEILYRYLVNLINSYEPETALKDYDFKVAHMGEVYEVTGNAARIMTGEGLLAGEVIEVMEYRRRAGKITEDLNAGNVGFSLGLSEMAILLRKPGEKLPESKPIRAQFIEYRRKLFETLPMDAVLNIRFFLTVRLLQSAKKGNTLTFSTASRAAGASPLSNSKKRRKWQKLFGMSPGST